MGGDQEEDYDYDEGCAEGDGAEASGCAVGVAGTAWGNDDGLDEGGLFVGRHGDGFRRVRLEMTAKISECYGTSKGSGGMNWGVLGVYRHDPPIR